MSTLLDSPRNACVWVLEIAILHARYNVIRNWEIWSAFNTRGEAVEYRNKEGKLPRKFWRIRKYVPEKSR